jgi:ketosteroid isomerase-like protein
VVHGIYENFARGDIPAVLASLDPEVEWIEAEQEILPHHGTHHTAHRP